jgi:hypothetical protein
VYRADDGKRWEAYVAVDSDDLLLLGVYRTIREAVAARAKYWKGSAKGKPARRLRAAA